MDWITHERTSHWVINALYIAEQVGILVYFLAFSASDIIESVTSFIVRTRKTLAKSVGNIKAESVAPSEANPAPAGTIPGYGTSTIGQSEDVQQKVGEEND